MKKLFLLAVAVISLSSFSLAPFSIGEDKVQFRLNNTDLSPVQIYVTDGQGRTVFSETLKGEKEVGKLFNFKSAMPDVYTIRVIDGDSTYIQTFTVK